MRFVLRWILRILALPFEKNEMGGKGQVAIFAALIFQVLFIFFAMIINVGLVVHHKINLQNSVDLAAYYGAMKQAENLNAIAHINYQIRQSWKLMTFRFRGIGMAGNEYDDPPFNGPKNSPGPGFSTDEEFKKCPASYCANFALFDFMNLNESYCRKPCTGTSVTLPGQPFAASILNTPLGALKSFVDGVEKVSAQARKQVITECQTKSALSWFGLARFIYSYKNDVQNRKRVLNKIANGMSYSTQDFLDLDGVSAKKGVLQTLWKNMTYQNQASLDPETGSGAGSFEFFNSMGASGCEGVQNEEMVPPRWLAEVFIKPLYSFLDGECAGAEAVKYPLKALNVVGNDNLPTYGASLDPSLKLLEFLRDSALDPINIDSANARMSHTTIGYEKNPWCMAYVKVKASTKPKIPFSPFSGIELKATAYAKPFGGSVGPWYYKSWPGSSPSSAGGTGDQVDKALPPRVKSGDSISATAADPYLNIDYSRYVGDKIGTKSTMTMGHFTKGLYSKFPAIVGERINMGWWEHLLNSEADLNSRSSPGDILAWDAAGGKSLDMRNIEIAAIIPDQFDLTYYSVEPNFWQTYAQRIQKRSDMSGLHVRGDLGYRQNASEPWNTFSVRNQIEKARAVDPFGYNDLLYYIGGGADPSRGFAELLTGWHNKVPGDYDLDSTRFGKCASPVSAPASAVEKATTGSCIIGGRVGYSVKIVDEEHLKSDLELGGSGITGRIKNQPPP